MNVLIGPNYSQISNIVYGLQINNCDYTLVSLKTGIKRIDLEIFPNSYFFSTEEELKSKSLDLLTRKKFDFILINADFLIPFFSVINEKFNLKGIKNKTVKIINNKVKQHFIFNKLGIPTPNIYKDNQKITYPYIKKLINGSGGNGVEIVEKNSSELLQENSNVILQEYINGDVCSVVGHIRGKQIFIDFLFDIIPEEGSFPVESDLRYPSKYKGNIEKKLIDYLKMFFNAIDLDNSPFMLDVVIKDGVMYFIDFSARLSITQILSYYAGDKNYIYNLVNSIVNGVNFEMKMEKAVIKKQLNLSIGRIKKIKCTREDLVDKITLPKNFVKPKNDNDVRTNGYMIVSGKDINEAQQKYDEVMRNIHVVYE
jgi:hypothetical protein